jgi:hypothetical protein
MNFLLLDQNNFIHLLLSFNLQVNHTTTLLSQKSFLKLISCLFLRQPFPATYSSCFELCPSVLHFTSRSRPKRFLLLLSSHLYQSNNTQLSLLHDEQTYKLQNCTLSLSTKSHSSSSSLWSRWDRFKYARAVGLSFHSILAFPSFFKRMSWSWNERTTSNNNIYLLLMGSFAPVVFFAEIN